MVEMKGYYITTTLPYVNAEPHIGFAMEIVRADVLARYHRLLGEEVFFNTGTDEHGQKIYQEALRAGVEPRKYVNEYVTKFEGLKLALNLSYNNFARTTDEHHVRAAQEFWRIVDRNGFIYKKNYKTKYCVGCELEKQDSELADGRCPIHPNKRLEIIEEENYFFRFSAFRKQLLKLYSQKKNFVVPENRMKEIRNFVEAGLEDFSVSRVKSKMPWGILVPGDETQVMYVWFDALINYVSALGWPGNEASFKGWWPAVQIAGKDNLRQQAAMWQAMLMAAGLPNSRQIVINGFINSEGRKMSKSLGNVVNPFEYVKQYGTDAVRFFLLAKISPFGDSDFSRKRFEECYVSELANGLGNLVARVAAMAEGEGFEIDGSGDAWQGRADGLTKALNSYEYDKAMAVIWDEVRQADVLINKKEVWRLKGEERRVVLRELVGRVGKIGDDLRPFMPETAEKILGIFGEKKIRRREPLFPRLT